MCGNDWELEVSWPSFSVIHVSSSEKFEIK